MQDSIKLKGRGISGPGREGTKNRNSWIADGALITAHMRFHDQRRSEKDELGKAPTVKLPTKENVCDLTTRKKRSAPGSLLRPVQEEDENIQEINRRQRTAYMRLCLVALVEQHLFSQKVPMKAFRRNKGKSFFAIEIVCSLVYVSIPLVKQNN